MTDAEARVLDRDGHPIPGLHACGNDMSSVMGGAYPGPGITLGPALVFGYIAARAPARGGRVDRGAEPGNATLRAGRPESPVPRRRRPARE